MTKPALLIFFAGLTGLFILGGLGLFFAKQESEGLTPNVDIPLYSMPWNDDPFFPGEIATLDGKLANWETVPSSGKCAKCHEKEYREWVSSMHAASGPDLIYEKVSDANEKAHISRLGVEKTRWCESCHEPLSNLTGRINPIPVVGPNDAAAEGTTCIVCHTAVASDPLAGNGALTLDINNINDYPEPLIMTAPARHARAMQAKTHNPLMGQSRMCGACHTESLPTSVNGDESLQLQDTFREWERSEYADKGIQCQDCHMNPNPAEYVAALKRDERPERVVSHRFVGVNYLLTNSNLPNNLVTFLRGGHPPGGIATEEWKQELLVQNGLVFDLLQEAADLELQLPDTVMPGRKVSLDVVINNTGAGHDLPTGARDQRYMWLEVKATDANGRILHHSGWFDGNTGQVDPAAVTYLKIIYDQGGRRITQHILFNADRIETTRKPIGAKESDAVPYAFDVPSDARGPLIVEVKLWYKLALQDIVAYTLKMNMVVPPVLLAEKSAEIVIQ